MFLNLKKTQNTYSRTLRSSGRCLPVWC